MWTSYLQDGSGSGIYGQRFAADGSAPGSEFRINQITVGDQATNSFYGSETIATLANGRLVQVWAGYGIEEVFFRLINVPVIVLDDTVATTEDTPVNIQMLANDGGFEGMPAIIGTTTGAHGTVAVNNNGTLGNTADDLVVYTPAPDFNGTDSFTYALNGGSTATVTVTVTPAADLVNDTATTNEDTSVNILVLANDPSEGTPARFRPPASSEREGQGYRWVVGRPHKMACAACAILIRETPQGSHRTPKMQRNG